MIVVAHARRLLRYLLAVIPMPDVAHSMKRTKNKKNIASMAKDINGSKYCNQIIGYSLPIEMQ